MSKSLFFLTLLFTTAAFATPLKKNNHLAYYGEDFYASAQQMAKKGYLTYYRQDPNEYTKRLLHYILNSKHLAKKGQYDEIGAICSDEDYNCYNQKSLSYYDARKIMFNELFNTEVNADTNSVIDVYCKHEYFYKKGTIPNSAMVNAEHTWPQSKFSSNFPSGTQKTDLHHLFPADSRANSDRGNYPFAEINGNGEPPQNCDDSLLGRPIQFKAASSATYFEPPADHKGNVARAMFYFSIRYNISIDPIQEHFFRLWHKEDPVDEQETRINDLIFKYQKNRNPFVDFPELVDTISDF